MNEVVVFGGEQFCNECSAERYGLVFEEDGEYYWVCGTCVGK